MAVVFAFLGEGLNLVEFLSLAFLFLIAGQYDWMMAYVFVECSWFRA